MRGLFSVIESLEVEGFTPYVDFITNVLFETKFDETN